MNGNRQGKRKAGLIEANQQGQQLGKGRKVEQSWKMMTEG